MIALALLLAAWPSVQDADAYEPYVAPASEEAETSSAAFALPEGFTIDLWAAEPLLANPVAFCFDRFGNAFVAETFRLHAGVTDMREHMDWLQDELSNTTVRDRVEMYLKFAGEDFHEIYETERERVRLLRDTDGDGSPDTATVFADDFGTAAAGIGAGVLATDDGVYFTCIPDLWFLRDADGDGVADVQRSLSTGYGVHVALLGHDLHGLVIGPDRRLYFSCGDRGLDVMTQESTRITLPHTGAVLRCELDGSNLELVHTGLRNPQELAFDEHGNLFTGDNNSDGGDRARFVQIVDGADTGWRFHYQYVTEPELRGPWNMEGQWKPWFPEQSAFLVPPIANITSGPSGLTYYPGTGLSRDYAGRFFLCDFRGGASYSNVLSFTLAPDGAGFTLEDPQVFLDGVLATDVDFGPDSALYVLDWVHGWGMTGKGRIWRVPPKDAQEAERAAQVQALLAGDWSARGVDELRGSLAHEDVRVRQAAQFALVDRGAEGREALLGAAREAESLLARLHGLWGLGVIARDDATALPQVLERLDDADDEVRAQSAKVLGDEFDARASAAANGESFGELVLGALTARTADESPRVAMYAALASARVARELGGQHPDTARAAATLLARAGTDDVVLRHAGVMALAASCSSAEPNPFEGEDEGVTFREVAASADPHVRMGACLVARRHDSPVALGRFLEDDDMRIRREAARALHELDDASRGHSAILAPHLGRADRDDPAFQRFALVANWRMGTEEAARRVAAIALDDARPEALRSEAMRMVVEWGSPSPVDPIHGAWFPLVPRDVEFVKGLALEMGATIVDAPDDIVRTWVELAGSLQLRELEPLMAELCADTSRPGATRAAALRALEAVFSPAYIRAVEAGIDDPDADFRAACLQELPELPGAKSIPVFERMLQSESVSDRRAVYRALASCGLDEAAELLAGEFAMLQQAFSLDFEAEPIESTIPAGAELELYRAVEQRLPDLPADLLDFDRLTEEDIAEIQASDPQLAEFRPEWMLFTLALDGGDAARGKALFESRAELSCLRCHPHDAGDAPSIGPSLDGLGERATRDEILTSILSPNQAIAEGFDTITIRMADDALLAGRVLAERDDELELLDADGEVWVVEKAQIAERVPALSAMPMNLPTFLTPEEMRDLIEYLANR